MVSDGCFEDCAMYGMLVDIFGARIKLMITRGQSWRPSIRLQRTQYPPCRSGSSINTALDT